MHSRPYFAMTCTCNPLSPALSAVHCQVCCALPRVPRVLRVLRASCVRLVDALWMSSGVCVCVCDKKEQALSFACATCAARVLRVPCGFLGCPAGVLWMCCGCAVGVVWMSGVVWVSKREQEGAASTLSAGSKLRSAAISSTISALKMAADRNVSMLTQTTQAGMLICGEHQIRSCPPAAARPPAPGSPSPGDWQHRPRLLACQCTVLRR